MVLLFDRKSCGDWCVIINSLTFKVLLCHCFLMSSLNHLIKGLMENDLGTNRLIELLSLFFEKCC